MKKIFTQIFVPWHQKITCCCFWHFISQVTTQIIPEAQQMLQNPIWTSSHLGWTNCPALNTLQSAMRSLRPNCLLRGSGQVWCHWVKPGTQKHDHNPSRWIKPQHHPKVCSIQVLPALPHAFLLLTGNTELLWAQQNPISDSVAKGEANFVFLATWHLIEASTGGTSPEEHLSFLAEWWW